MQMSIPVQPGNSGGPVMNEKGELLGVVNSEAAAGYFLHETGALPQNVNWASRIENAVPLYPAPAALTPTASIHEAIDRTMKATCLIQVRIRVSP